MEDLKKVFAGKLLAIKAVKLQPNDPFTWASGWKSPFFQNFLVLESFFQTFQTLISSQSLVR